MIESALVYLAKMLGEVFSEVSEDPYQFKVIYSDMEDASKGITDAKTKYLSGYIKPTTITTDEGNRKQRKLTANVNSNDISYIVELHPCRVDIECKVSLYQGQSQVYKLIPALIGVQSKGKADFTLNLALGDEDKIPIPVQVRSESMTIDFPSIETEPDSGESYLLFNLSMFNIFSILGSHEIPTIIEMASGIKVNK